MFFFKELFPFSHFDVAKFYNKIKKMFDTKVTWG